MRKPVFKVGRIDIRNAHDRPDRPMQLHAEWYRNDGNAGLHVYAIGRTGTVSFSAPGMVYMARVNLRYPNSVPFSAWMVLSVGPVKWELRLGRRKP